jgi:hypothetical protein
MISHAEHPDRPVSSVPGVAISRQKLRRLALVLLAPLAVYAIVRPLVATDALGLGIAGAIPILYSIVLSIRLRSIDYLVLLSAVGFSIACVVSLLAGGSSLPLKLSEATITFVIGIVLLIATLIRRPIALAHLLRIPSPTKQIDGSLGAMIGGFLVLHALLHLTLAVSLSPSSYLVLSRVIDWGTLALGFLALRAYVRRARARSAMTER